MTYFCTKCQMRHPIEDISADMWGICREELRGALQDTIQEFKMEYESDGDEIEDMEDELIRFLNNSDTVPINRGEFHGTGRIGAYFPLNRRNVEQLENLDIKPTMVSGTYVITLNTLIDVSVACSANSDAASRIRTGANLLSADYQYRALCRKDVVMLLNKHGALDRVMNANNEPFVIGGKMLGFTKICTHCGCILSRAAGSAEEVVVALAGSARAGKTSSMIAMINSLISGSNPYLRVIPTPHDEYWRALETEIRSYRACRKITKTVAKLTDVPFYSMLVQINDPKKTERVLTLVDMAGEFWSGEDGSLSAEFFTGYSRLYEALDCIWFVTSKATVRLSGIYATPDRRVVEELSKATSEEYEIIQRSDPSTLTGNLSLLKDQLRLKLNKPMPPTVVIVTKPDFCISSTDVNETRNYRLFPVGCSNVNQYNAQDLSCLFHVQERQLYGVNEQNLRASATMVRNFIEYKNSALISAIESNCEKRFYTVLSAYGRPALSNSDEGSSEPQPFHELVPLVWTLAITGAIPVIHDVHWMKKNMIGRVVSETDTREIVTCDYRKADSDTGTQNSDQAAMCRDIIKNLTLQADRFQRTVIPHERR